MNTNFYGKLINIHLHESLIDDEGKEFFKLPGFLLDDDGAFVCLEAIEKTDQNKLISLGLIKINISNVKAITLANNTYEKREYYPSPFYVL